MIDDLEDLWGDDEDDTESFSKDSGSKSNSKGNTNEEQSGKPAKRNTFVKRERKDDTESKWDKYKI